MEPLKHECGVAMIRLLKPLEYYQERYGTWMYGLNKIYLLMMKQHNRGQEGAGLASVKLTAQPGEEYMFRERALGTGAITDIFQRINSQLSDCNADKLSDMEYVRQHLPFAGELYMGHLRYSTTGKRGLSYVHPFLRRHNWRLKNLAICGNFNMANVDDVFDEITSEGQHPRKFADTYILLEQLGNNLDIEVDRLFKENEQKGLVGKEKVVATENQIDLSHVIKSASPSWDGGYVICGLTGSGESFAVRDPWGIRTAFWYKDDEKIVIASERPVIQTVLNVPVESINELEPGQAIFIRRNGDFRLEQILQQQKKMACSFERVYFSRGSDLDIYKERKMMGRMLTHQVLRAVDYDIEHTVVSFIPNTAEVAFYGLVQGIDEYLTKQKVAQIEAMNGRIDRAELSKILNMRVRSEKVAIKDIKLRTFIAEGNSRNDLAAHVYDVTYGSLEPYEDNLAIIDDSIVRGTTLRQSIISILDRLHPKRIVIVSSSPQVRYPDYYGIDMASMDQLIAFKAAIELLKDRGMTEIITEVYEKSIAQRGNPESNPINYVKEIYSPFTDEEISAKIAELLTPKSVNAEVKIVYQTIEGLHASCPNHQGDWYFSGDYPTFGGIMRVNQAFIDYVENNYNTKDIFSQNR